MTMDNERAAHKKEILNTYEKSKKLGLGQKESWLLDQEGFLPGLNMFRAHYGSLFFKLKGLPEQKLKIPSQSNPILKFEPLLDDPTMIELGKVDGKTNLKMRVDLKYNLLEACKRNWERFCAGWSIYSSWDGELRTLSKYIYPSVRISTEDRATIGRKEILITLNAWATKKEMDAMWKTVEKLKDQLYSGGMESKEQFVRHLCWHNLAKKGFLISEIADLWVKNYPQDVDLMVLNRIKKCKNDMEPLLRSIPKPSESAERRDYDLRLLREIKSGKWPELKNIFDNEWRLYVKNQTLERNNMSRDPESGKLKKEPRGTPPFDDTIGEAIIRMGRVLQKTIKFQPEHKPLHRTFLN